MTRAPGDGALELTPAETKTVVSLLTRYLSGTEVWAFGSRTNGNATRTSDLDLVAFTDTEQAGLIQSAREAFEASDLRFRVDLLEWQEVPESFREEIRRRHVVLTPRRTAPGPGWRTRKMADFAPLKYGKALRGPHRVEDGAVPVFGSNGQVGNHDEAVTAGPTVIVGRKGTVGAVHYSPEPCWPIDTTYWHEEPDADLCRFKYYLLGALRLDELNSDSAVPVLSRSVAHALTAPVPPAAEQRRVARFLGALDDRIDLSARIARKLEAMARAIFKDWFVDFGPTRVKMEGRDPYLPTELWDLFPERLEVTKTGEIPEGWSVRSFDEIADYRNGLALQKYRPAAGEEALPVVKIAQLRAGAPDGKEWASCAITPECIIDDGDVVFSWSGSLLVDLWCGGRAALDQHLFRVTSARHPKWFYYFQLKSRLPVFRQIAGGKVTTMGHINLRHLSTEKCVVPDGRLLEAAGDVLGRLIEGRIRRTVSNRGLAAVRDLLAPRLLSGSLTVDGRVAVEQMGEASSSGDSE